MPFGECALGRRLLVVLHVDGGVPLEEHLRGMRAESLFADSIPSVIGIADIRAEQPQRVLVTTHSRLLASFDRPQIAEELLNQGRRPHPRELIVVLDETLNQPDSSRNRVMAQVAAHLLIAPSLQHLIDGLHLRMQQRNRSDDMHAATLVEGQISLQTGLIRCIIESLTESIPHRCS
jgi:hypothetical protein